jgi:hypothetical protein
MRPPKGRLELTWMGKDMALIPTAHGEYDYEWVDPADARACEVKSIEKITALRRPRDARRDSAGTRDQCLASAALSPSISAEPNTTRLFVAT